jgi:hypothetical protein
MFCFVLFWYVLSLTSNHATQIYVSIFKMGSQVRHTYLNSKSSIINGSILVTVESVEVKNTKPYNHDWTIATQCVVATLIIYSTQTSQGIFCPI